MAVEFVDKKEPGISVILDKLLALLVPLVYLDCG
jgi:hypothetical protein